MLDNNDDDEDDEEVNDETSDDEKHNGDRPGYISATITLSYALAGINWRSRSFGVTEARRRRSGRGILGEFSERWIGGDGGISCCQMEWKHGGSDARRRRSTGRARDGR